MPRKNAKPTPAQSAASRRNGAQGGRPRDPNGTGEARRIAARARELGLSQREENIKFWISVRDDSTAPLESRLRAIEQIEDRYGQPRQTAQISMPVDIDATKLLELTGFQPPASWVAPDDEGAEGGEAE